MKRRPTTGIGQFTLALQREPSPDLGNPKREEVLDALAELMLEALGGGLHDNQNDKEAGDESEDHA